MKRLEAQVAPAEPEPFDEADFLARGNEIRVSGDPDDVAMIDTLIAEIEATGAQVLGFERAPRDPAERAAVAAAELWFGSGREMIGVPTAAGCYASACVAPRFRFLR